MANWLDRAIGAVSPKAGAERAAWRVRKQAIEQMESRGYAAARKDRLTAGWHSVSRSPDAELLPDLYTLKARGRQMTRDDSYAASAKRNFAAQLIGDGIEARAVHADPKIAKLAQDYWAKWCKSKVDGRNTFYGVQKLVALSLTDEGEKLILWKADGDRPDAKLAVLDGDYLDGSWSRMLPNGGKVVGGVYFDPDGDRTGYQLWNRHPGDLVAGVTAGLTSYTVDAQYVDHVFEAKWGGQARGEPLFHAGLRRLRDISDLEESIRIKKRVEACLALIRKPAADDSTDPIGQQSKVPEGPVLEQLAPGMIASLKPGEGMEVVNPSSSGDSDTFQKSQLRAAAASIGLPTHMMTGDVSDANYSSLRAATLVFYAILDDLQQNVFIPLLCQPAFDRTMKRAALELDEPKLLQVTADWTPPARQWVDPLKDITAEILEIRAIPGLMSKAYAERGLNAADAMADQFNLNKIMDQYGLASDADPRKVNGVGNLQPPAGFVLAQPGADAAANKTTQVPQRALRLIQRSLLAEEEGDEPLARVLLEEASSELRRAA